MVDPAAYRPSGAYNFDVATRVLENLWTPGCDDVLQTSEYSINFISLGSTAIKQSSLGLTEMIQTMHISMHLDHITWLKNISIVQFQQIHFHLSRLCNIKQVVEQCLVVVIAKQVKLLQNEYYGL
jgi:hypothetical protein